VRTEFLQGMGALAGQKFVMLLEIDRLLNEDEIAAAAAHGARDAAGEE
jgi:chemotaxis signal transduction protein